MKTYYKILMTMLPIVFCLLLATVGTAYYFSRTALNELAETWLDTRLGEAMKVVASQDNMLRRYGLETIPASIDKAKLDASKLIASIDVGDAGYIFAVDADGIIALHPDATMVGTDVSREPWFRTRTPGRHRLIQLTPEGRNLTVMDYFQPWAWSIFVSDPEREVYGVANRMKPYFIGIGIVGFTLISVALMLLTRRIMKPLMLLTAGVEQIGRGAFDTRIDTRSQDEFGRLAGVFNNMAGQLHETLGALQHREAYFRSLIENASDLITIVDTEGVVLYLSPSVERMLGYPRDEVMGTRAFDYVHPEDSNGAIRLLKMGARGNRTEAPSVLRIRHKDGSWRTLEATSNNLFENPAVKGLVVNARDISKRKAAEEALQQAYNQLEGRVAERTAELIKINAKLRTEIDERKQMMIEKEQLQDQLLQAQKMEAIGTLAGGIAHDFNNLLMGIQGNVDLLAMEPELARHHEQLVTIRDCVFSGTGLTKQLLGFARMGKYEAQVTNPNDLVNKSADIFARTRQEIRIVPAYQEDVWSVNVDRGQIEQVLLNLFINAWQAMPDGGTLTLETANVIIENQQAATQKVNPGNYVRISVIDTGVGMDKATQERIFDPFFTTKAMKRGTGLGLASAYGIIRNHGGFIDVHSRINQGTTFNIYLKTYDAAVVETKAKPELPSKGTETILLVDDDAVIVDVGQALLHSLGYTVLVADGGKDAIDMYREQCDRIALVILDMIMPDMGGGRTFDALKRINPGVKVLLSSGYSLEGQASEILARGCSGFIQKPFDLQKLSKKMREIIEA